jgi:hypothetical protein
MATLAISERGQRIVASFRERRISASGDQHFEGGDIRVAEAGQKRRPAKHGGYNLRVGGKLLRYRSVVPRMRKGSIGVKSSSDVRAGRFF